MKKNIKTIISCMLLLAMLFASVTIQAAETDSADFRLENQQITVMVGSSFDVPLFIANNPGMMGFDIMIEYDKNYVEPVGVSAGTVLRDETLNDSIDTSTINSFHVMWAGTDNVTADGELFTIKFNLKKLSETGGTSISFQAISENTYNESYDGVNIGSAALHVKTTTDAILKKQPSLAVYMEDWVMGERASAPVLVGNTENGAVTYEYSAAPAGTYSKDVPTQIGRYYLRATVAETDNYQSGITTCTFRILEKSKSASTKDAEVTPPDSGTSVKSKITVNLKKKKYNVRYKVKVQSTVKLKRIKINDRVIKGVNGRKNYTFRLSKYKRYLRKKKWNTIAVWDANGKKLIKKFKVK